MSGPPRAHEVFGGLWAGRGGEWHAGRRTIARCPHPSRTRFRASTSTRPAARGKPTARIAATAPARPRTRNPARIGTGTAARARARTPPRVGTPNAERTEASVQAGVRHAARACIGNAALAGGRIRARADAGDPAWIGTGILARAGAKARVHARACARNGTACRTRIHTWIAGLAQPWVQAAFPAQAGPARGPRAAAKAWITSVTWIAGTRVTEAWISRTRAAVPPRIRARPKVTAAVRLIPPVRAGPPIQGSILIGAGAGRAPARVPRGPRTAVAHAPSPVPGRLVGCRRDPLKVTPS